MLSEVVEQLKNDGVIVTLSNNQKIDVTGDQSKISHWLPVIKQHKQEIIEQLSKRDSDLEKIRSWLFSIGELEEDHYLVIDKCKADHEAMTYFLRHANGEFDSSYTVTDEQRADDRAKCSDCLYLVNGYCQKYQVTNHGAKYRPEQSTPKRCNVFKAR